MIERINQAGLYRLIVGAVTAVALLMVATVGLPGAPADEYTFGVIVIILIVAFSAWAIADPPLLLVCAVIAVVALAVSAPSVLPTAVLIAGMLIAFGIPALIGISFGLGKGKDNA